MLTHFLERQRKYFESSILMENVARTRRKMIFFSYKEAEGFQLIFKDFCIFFLSIDASCVGTEKFHSQEEISIQFINTILNINSLYFF